MNKKFVARWEEKAADTVAELGTKDYLNYADLVHAVVTALHDDYGSPDPERITEVNYGDYQGTLVYVIGASGYQPNTHWYVKVSYGSCSGCDTLAAIDRDYDDATDKYGYTAQGMKDIETLCLHIVQGMHAMLPDWNNEEDEE